MEKFKSIVFKMLVLLNRRHIEGCGLVKYSPRLTHFILGEGSKLLLKGDLIIGENSNGYNGRSNIIRLDRNALVVTEGSFSFMYGADVIVFPEGQLTLGNNSFINSDCKIRCHKKITIGEGCKISHDFTLMDSDAHELDGDRHTNDVEIGNNVWIGTRVTILSGTKIGDGCVVAAGAVVRGEFPPHSLIGGVPAKVLRTNVEWSN